MNKVKRAIIMAAGMGTRLRPLTYTTAKPLIKVNGISMIENTIQGLIKNNITEIYVVIGYLKEQFQFLPKKYPGLKLIENPYYKNTNYISTIYMARNYLEDSIILEGDLKISNFDILNSEFERSCYNCIYREKTPEWCLDVKDGIITNLDIKGGKKGWQLYGISRWTKNDAIKLKKHVEIEFKKNGNIYFDEIPLKYYKNDYEIGIFKMNNNDVVEIDTLEELKKIDSSYNI